MTRQRRWQLKMRVGGRCAHCGGEPLKERRYCARYLKRKCERVKALYRGKK